MGQVSACRDKTTVSTPLCDRRMVITQLTNLLIRNWASADPNGGEKGVGKIAVPPNAKRCEAGGTLRCLAHGADPTPVSRSHYPPPPTYRNVAGCTHPRQSVSRSAWVASPAATEPVSWVWAMARW